MIELQEFLQMDSLLTLFMIFLCPVTWNVVSRLEFYTNIFSRLVGDKRIAADICAHIYIEMGIFRNFMFYYMVTHHPATAVPEALQLPIKALAAVFFVFGLIVNFGVLYRLGIHGIYYADYFDILCPEKATKWPFSTFDHPLYVGSTLIFLGDALYNFSVIGVCYSFFAYFMYMFASSLEGPYTDQIYSASNIKRIQEEKNKSVKSR
jgi:phosphatidylethanolamine N-methyltransferase